MGPPMQALLESDSELEQQARAQAEAIAQARSLAQRTKLQLFFSAVGQYLRIAPEPQEIPVSAQRPGRELLLWQMRQCEAMEDGLPIAFELIGDARFIVTVPEGRDCPIAFHEARRTWNEAAREWSGRGGGQYAAWLRCDRKLLLRREGPEVTFWVAFKDLEARFDPAAGKLAPVRSEGVRPIGEEDLAVLVALFPNLNPYLLAEGMRAPARALMAGFDKRKAQDAYVANGPLRIRLDDIADPNQQRPRELSKSEEVGRGFAAWLATLIKANGR